MGRGTILGTQQIRASCWKSTKPFSFRKSFTSDLQSVFCIHGQKATPVESGKTNFSKLSTLSESFSNEEIIKCYE